MNPVEHIVQKLDREREAKGKAIVEANDRKRSQMTRKEIAAQVKADNDALFGPEQ